MFSSFQFKAKISITKSFECYDGNYSFTWLGCAKRFRYFVRKSIATTTLKTREPYASIVVKNKLDFSQYCLTGMTILLAASGAHVTERSFKRVEHADLEELYSNALQNVSVHSLATCSTLCSQNVDCRSYAWTNYASQCFLLSKDVRRNSFNPLISPDIAVYTTCRYCSDNF